MALQLTGEDDFDVIPVKGNPTLTAAAAVAAATLAPTTTNDDVSFDDAGINDAVKITNDLPMIKISKGEVARFAFVPNVKIKRGLTHYLDGKGSILCNSTPQTQAACCKNSDKYPQDKFIGLVYRYQNIDRATGKFAAGVTVPVVAVEAVRMSRSNMRDILDSVEEGESVYSIDVRMRHDDGRAFGYKFSKASSKNAWRSLEPSSLPSIEPFKDGGKLASRLGKKLNAIELAAAFSSKTGGAGPSLADLHDLDSLD